MHTLTRSFAALAVLAGSLSAQSFVDATNSAGLGGPPGNWVLPLGPIPNYFTSPSSTVDYDGDGWDDISAGMGDATPLKLFRNEGDGTFTEGAKAAGIQLMGPYSHQLWGDTDDDGDLDMLIFAYGNVIDAGALGGPGTGIPISTLVPASDPNQVDTTAGKYRTIFYENQGDGTFVENAKDCGLTQAGRTGGVFTDLDGDLDLDMFSVSWGGDRANVLVNNGSGIFRERTPFNVNQSKARGFSVHAVDYDGDGDNDILQTCDFGRSLIWRNEGGFQFTELEDEDLGIDDEANGMGSAIADFDHDGDFDWFISAIYADIDLASFMDETGNQLYRNDGGGQFTDISESAGISNGAWGWGSVFADLDNDGNQDIVHTNGWWLDLYFDDLIRVFHNNGDETFDEVAVASGLYDDGQGRGLSAFDYDQDGKIDILVNNRDTGLGLWKNTTAVTGNYLDIGLVGTTNNSYGIGAKISVRQAPSDRSGTSLYPQHFLVEAACNFQSQSPPRVWAGLDGLQTVLVRVDWPSGLSEVFEVTTNQRIDLVEGTGNPPL